MTGPKKRPRDEPNRFSVTDSDSDSDGSPNIQLDFSAEQGIPWYEREMERTLENLSQQLSQTSVQENAKDDGSNDVYGISYDAEKEGAALVASDEEDDLIMDWNPEIMHEIIHSKKTLQCIDSAVQRFQKFCRTMARHYEKAPHSEAVKDFLPFKKYFRKTAEEIVKGVDDPAELERITELYVFWVSRFNVICKDYLFLQGEVQDGSEKGPSKKKIKTDGKKNSRGKKKKQSVIPHPNTVCAYQRMFLCWVKKVNHALYLKMDSKDVRDRMRTIRDNRKKLWRERVLPKEYV